MKHPSKFCFLLFSLVLTVYIMRQTDISVGTVVSHTLRALAGARPSATLCTSVDSSQTPTESQTSKAQSTKESVQSMRGGNPLLDSLMSGSDVISSDYVTSMISLVAPWIVMLVISLIICISLCCNWCYLHGCCKNRKICACCKPPQQFAQKKICVGVTLLFLMGTFATSIAGLSFVSQLPEGMNLTLCSLISVMEDLAYGVPSEKWMGLESIVTTIGDIVTKFDAAVSGLTTTSSSSAIQGYYNDITTDLGNMQTLYSAQTVTRPKPTLAAYKPAYTANVGPYSDLDSKTGQILTEVTIQKEVVVNAETQVNPAIVSMQTDSGSIKSGIEDGKKSAQEFADNIQDILDSLGDTGSTAKDVIKGIGAGLLAIFAIFLATSVISIASLGLFFFKKIKVLTKVLHFSWCLIFVLSIISWILGTIFYPLSIVIIEACDVLDKSLNDEQTLKTVFTNLLDAKVSDMLDVCIHSAEGNMLDNIDLGSSLANFNTMFEQIDSVDAVIPLGSSSPPTCANLTSQLTEVAQIRDSLVADGAETTADLTALNAFVNSNSKPCVSSVRDTWILNSANCPSGVSKFQTVSSDTYDIPNPTCIGFDAWTTPAHSINLRYTTQFTSCPNVGASTAVDYARQFVTNFKTNRNDVYALFNNVRSSLNVVKGHYTSMASSMQPVVENLNTLKTKIADVRTLLEGDDVGLFKNSKCTFVKSGMQEVNNAMCVRFATTLYQSSAVIIAVSVLTVFAALSLFLLLKRIHLPEYIPTKTLPSPSELRPLSS